MIVTHFIIHDNNVGGWGYRKLGGGGKDLYFRRTTINGMTTRVERIRTSEVRIFSTLVVISFIVFTYKMTYYNFFWMKYKSCYVGKKEWESYIILRFVYRPREFTYN